MTERQPAKLRKVLGTVSVRGKDYVLPMERDEIISVTDADIKKAELQLDIAKLEAAPRPERITFCERVLAALTVEARLAATPKATPEQIRNKIQVCLNGRSVYQLCKELGWLDRGAKQKGLERFMKAKTDSMPDLKKVAQALSVLTGDNITPEDLQA